MVDTRKTYLNTTSGNMNPPMDIYGFLDWLNDGDPDIMKYIPKTNIKPKWLVKT